MDLESELVLKTGQVILGASEKEIRTLLAVVPDNALAVLIILYDFTAEALVKIARERRAE